MKPLLRHARALVAGGWSEPFNTTTDGRPTLDPEDEGLANYSVEGALSEASRLQRVSTEQTLATWGLLESIATPAWTAFLGAPSPAAMLSAARMPGCAEGGLQRWLEAPGRRLRDVLAIFDAAILKGGARW